MPIDDHSDLKTRLAIAAAAALGLAGCARDAPAEAEPAAPPQAAAQRAAPAPAPATPSREEPRAAPPVSAEAEEPAEPETTTARGAAGRSRLGVGGAERAARRSRDEPADEDERAQGRTTAPAVRTRRSGMHGPDVPVVVEPVEAACGASCGASCGGVPGDESDDDE